MLHELVKLSLVFDNIQEYFGEAFYIEVVGRQQLVGVLSRIEPKKLIFKTWRDSNTEVRIEDYFEGRVKLYKMKKDKLL